MDAIVPLFIVILALPCFVFWRIFFAQRINKSKSSRTISTIIATAISAPILYVLLVAIWIFSIEHYPSKKFDKKSWDSEIDQRYELSEKIISSRMLIGKGREEVKHILGAPGESQEGKDNWYYDLGLRPGIGNIEPDMLIVTFIDGFVIEVEQRKGD